MQTQLNNCSNTIIEVSFIKIIYDFKIKKAFLLLYDRFIEFIIDNLSNRRLEYHVEISEIIAFANAKNKSRLKIN